MMLAAGITCGGTGAGGVVPGEEKELTRRLSFALALVVAMLAVPVALADPPVIVPAPAVDFTDSTSCAFPVAIHFTANGETAKIFSDRTIIVTGPLAATFSANGKSVSLNISGPVKISPTGVAIAHGLGAGPVLLPNGQVTLAYFAGPVDISTGTGGVPLNGHLRLDLCAALAP